MFGASSSTPKVDLKRGYAAAASSVSSNANGSRSLGRAAVVVVSAAVVVGVTAAVGGSLLYGASRRTGSGDDESTLKPATEDKTSSLWQRALRFVHLRPSAEDDDDDAFASGTGAASLFDDAKTQARQLSKDKSMPSARAPAAAVAQPSKTEKPGSPPTAKADAVSAVHFPSDVREREQHIKLVRALLRREAGIEYSDDDSDASSSSDETDVSLHYHFATTMEATARDELLMAFAAFEDFNEGQIYGSASPEEGAENAEELQVTILVRTLEYLDMSNEREKLRYRRIALYREQGRATPASSVDAAEGEGDGADEEEGEDDEDPMNALYRHLAARYAAKNPTYEFDDEEGEDDGDHFYPGAAGAQLRQFQAMFGPSMMSAGPQAQDANTGDSILDRVLGQAPASAKAGGRAAPTRPAHRAAAHDDGEDMMEDEWEDEDDGEEAEFMAYLQQPDDAAHFYSRKEMRQARRDPGNDVRVVGPLGAMFGLHDDDAEAEEDWEDDGAGEEGDEEEGGEMDAEPWTRQDKADFERELFGRIHQLAGNYTLTAAMAEREADEEDSRKLAERQHRREQQQKARAPPAPGAAPKAVRPAAPVVDDDDEDEEWEDEGEWEDEDECA